MTVDWDYKEQGLSREEAEAKIISLGAIPCLDSGWYMPTYCKSHRLHLKPSGGGINIHVDTGSHHVHRGKKAKKLVAETIEKLIANK